MKVHASLALLWFAGAFIATLGLGVLSNDVLPSVLIVVCWCMGIYHCLMAIRSIDNRKEK